MKDLELSNELKTDAIDKIREYFAENMDNEIGVLAAELLLDFLIENIGAIFYNQGISDAQKYMNERADDLYALMK